MQSTRLLFNGNLFSNHTVFCPTFRDVSVLFKLHIYPLYFAESSWCSLQIWLEEASRIHSMSHLEYWTALKFPPRLMSLLPLISVFDKVSGCGQNLDKFSARVWYVWPLIHLPMESVSKGIAWPLLRTVLSAFLSVLWQVSHIKHRSQDFRTSLGCISKCFQTSFTNHF